MESLIWKMRLSILWVFLAGGWVVGFLLYLMLPGAIKDIMTGYTGNSPITEWRLILYSLFYIIPFTMAVLCLTLPDHVIRWLNVVMGCISGIGLLGDITIHAINLSRGVQESLGVWLVIITDFIICVIIITLSLKSHSTEVLNKS